MTETQRAAAYVPWTTFSNSLNRLAEGLPVPLDKSAFQNLAGSTRVQLIAAYKFLGLLSEEHIPSKTLKELVELNELERKPVLRVVLERAYPEVFALNLSTATPKQLNDTMAQHYGVSGSTLNKAVRFLLGGLSDVGVEVSHYIQEDAKRRKPRSNGGATRRRSVPKKEASPNPATPPKKDPDPFEGIPAGMARQDIPTLEGAYIVYPVDMTEGDVALFDAALTFIKAVVKKGGK